ncbi:MAG: M28 family peptidase [Pirellulaceae bacterium]
MTRIIHLLTAAMLASACLAQTPAGVTSEEETNDGATNRESQLIVNIRQLTFDGLRSGEGYFDKTGQRMVFQSERESGNPFYQIYLVDLTTGDTVRVSPGTGKTTCAWLHPTSQQVLFASTHEDPRARDKQREKLEFRASGKERRYAWDYDPGFELFVKDLGRDTFTRLTDAEGYDAEGSFSPDGTLIAWSSNRHAYSEKLPPNEQQLFEQDPASANEIYIMQADGTNVRRLTNTVGYDGGPFFSPDGTRICWRRFSQDGATAEIMTMNIDGSDVSQLTRLGAMSWAPFYHPSGDYLVFTTNLHGFGNFELYLVDSQGKGEPVRVTHTDGFDGLPAFTPDGNRIAWTSTRGPQKRSQIFWGDWNHHAARQMLGLDRQQDVVNQTDEIVRVVTTDNGNEPEMIARQAARSAEQSIVPQDILRHVDYLCRDQLEGRRTGTDGERLATSYVAAYMDNLGLLPAGDDGGWYQPFEFTAGMALGDDNKLAWIDRVYELNKEWRPVAFSETGEVTDNEIVFAGYGIVAPAGEDQAEYDSYVHLDVEDKWVVMLRFMPEGISPERRQYLAKYSSLRHKTMQARDRGAKGVVFVSGPTSQVKEPLIRLQFDGTLSGSSIPVLSVSDAVATEWLSAADADLAQIQAQLDRGELVMGTPIPAVRLRANVAIERVRQTGRNVLGRLQMGETPSEQFVLVGAHVDHLGKGSSASSLARDDEQNGIHYGADDNASGVAGMLEIAEYLVARKRAGKLAGKRDVLFVAWSGEELGLLGASHYAEQLGQNARSLASHPHQEPPHHGLADHIVACLNLDMIGRLEKNLILQGIGSSSIWRGEIERRNVPVGLPITLQDDCYLPTDASVFYMRGVPILSAFTGSHSEYHTPRDTPDKLNYRGAAEIARLMALITEQLVKRDDAPDYVEQTRPAEGSRRANLRAYLGTIPDYASTDEKGVKLSGVAKDGPAAKAGVQAGDLIVELAGKRIDNIYDYTYAIEALKIGEQVTIVVQRGSENVALQVTPGSRD